MLTSVGRVAHPDAPEQKLAGIVSSSLVLAFLLGVHQRWSRFIACLRALCHLCSGGKVSSHPRTARICNSEWSIRRLPTVVANSVIHCQPTAVPDPWTLVTEFKQAAINAKKAGFDGVERKRESVPLFKWYLPTLSTSTRSQWLSSHPVPR